MMNDEVKESYIKNLKNKPLTEARIELFREMSSNNYKLDKRFVDWVYLIDPPEFNRILVLGSEFSESLIYFHSLFNKIDFISQNILDIEILEIINQNYSNISLLDINQFELIEKYDVIYIDSCYKPSIDKKLLYFKLGRVLKKKGILAKMHERKILKKNNDINMILDLGLSYANKYAWLPIANNSPVFIFDVNNHNITKYFLNTMSNIFQSVSPENKKKFNSKILILKSIKIVFGIKYINLIFKFFFPCYLLIFKK